MEDAPYHDLDHLWGSWSSEETEAFETTTQPFEKIDRTLWV